MDEDGETIADHKEEGKRVFSKQTSWNMTRMPQQVVKKERPRPAPITETWREKPVPRLIQASLARQRTPGLPAIRRK